jgi:hypothetical protein
MNEKMIFDFYSQPGLMTDPGEHIDLLVDMPTDPGLLCQVVQGCLLHIFWADRHGFPLSEERKQEVQIRGIARKLARLRQLDDRPLVSARPIERKLVGNCRGFALLLTALFQYRGIPARARCGFGTYFLPGHYEDHWVCEYWDVAKNRWVRVDSQLDALQRQVLSISFDPIDVPASKFLTGGDAWKLCRDGRADPDTFGIFQWHGMGFVRGDLLRDFLALNKIEILPWDSWKLFEKKHEDLSSEELTFLDHIADLILAGDKAFSEIRSVYKNNPELHIPEDFEI